MRRREFLKSAAAGALAATAPSLACRDPARPTPNLLVLTADDMNWDTPGCYGGRVADATPRIDQLATEGLRLGRGHVTISVCQPSRSVWMTGRYPHRNGAMGFEPIAPGIPVLTDPLRAAGYRTGILGKVKHLTPFERFGWDLAVDGPDLGEGRDPARFRTAALDFFRTAGSGGRQPFFLLANAHDPHRPFAGTPAEVPYFGRRRSEVPAPSRSFAPEEVEVPPFLPDLPIVRAEVAAYMSSVRRADDVIGGVLDALAEAGAADDTLVMFLSDNGMAFPFAKTNCYLNSTRVPWIVRWPGRVPPGTVDDRHFASGIDLMPTLLDAAGIAPVPGVDGASFLPILGGSTQAGRTQVTTVFHETFGHRPYPMRCVQDERFGYIYNAWADGEAPFVTEADHEASLWAMRQAAPTNPDIAARLQLFLYRVPEELYDLGRDPHALVNLATESAHAADLATKRVDLRDWMRRTEDPLLPTYEQHLATVG